jgi:hypothetical protein
MSPARAYRTCITAHVTRHTSHVTHQHQHQHQHRAPLISSFQQPTANIEPTEPTDDGQLVDQPTPTPNNAAAWPSRFAYLVTIDSSSAWTNVRWPCPGSTPFVWLSTGGSLQAALYRQLRTPALLSCIHRHNMHTCFHRASSNPIIAHNLSVSAQRCIHLLRPPPATIPHHLLRPPPTNACSRHASRLLTLDPAVPLPPC